MSLKYVGPKVRISKSGIEFDRNKEDKYVYLHDALQLLKAIDHEYVEDKIYTYTADPQQQSDDQLFALAKQFCPNIDKEVDEARQKAEAYVDELVARAKTNTLIHRDDRLILINNLNIMRHYLIQRAINKSIYYCMIRILVTKLRHSRVQYIAIEPIYRKFIHVLHTVQGVLINQRAPVISDIDIFEERGKLLIKLNMKSL